MATDLLFMERNNEIEKFAKTLGYTRILFREDLEKLNIREAKDYTDARRLVEHKSVKILLNPHSFGKRDNYTADRPGLDHILASMASKNNIAIAFGLNKINNLVEMNWVMQSIQLCRKYKARMLKISGAIRVVAAIFIDVVIFLSSQKTIAPIAPSKAI